MDKESLDMIYEIDQAFQERREKRFISVILTLIVILCLSNIAWLYSWLQYDYASELELDGVKAQVEAKNDRIGELQSQLNMAALRESQVAQNAFIAQGFSNEVDQLYNRLNNCPVPTTPVYGRTPIFTCNGQQSCGCGGNTFYN